ncbi:hypothetical protein LEP1GSC203_2872 [Leptospira terpstrae serovar Hualin str. LT 11-33 = ATCC 700639]|uniref:Uncharacterized protein n=1 Tax=Leptospira terpstrae serovar Hualin str. LT 11-33 = ATCC 700639 TaxID=1257025 RepID=N1W1Q5_9LEPT|nr:hypothetical protein LEP1GSC203_2872 [Leptospira terpstrae serovar Hualin str. LT 11-33 = ATCC 700639]
MKPNNAPKKLTSIGLIQTKDSLPNLSNPIYFFTNFAKNTVLYIGDFTYVIC